MLWVADDGTGLSTLHTRSGMPLAKIVAIPGPGGTGVGTPSGEVANDTADLVITGGSGSGPARFLFATEDGTIVGWGQNADPNNGIVAVDNSASGAVYKGLALGHSSGENFIFATDFDGGQVDVFDAGFAPAGQSRRPSRLPTGAGLGAGAGPRPDAARISTREPVPVRHRWNRLSAEGGTCVRDGSCC